MCWSGGPSLGWTAEEEAQLLPDSIIAGVVGGLFCAAVLALCLTLSRRRARRQQAKGQAEHSDQQATSNLQAATGGTYVFSLRRPALSMACLLIVAVVMVAIAANSAFPLSALSFNRRLILPIVSLAVAVLLGWLVVMASRWRLDVSQEWLTVIGQLGGPRQVSVRDLRALRPAVSRYGAIVNVTGIMLIAADGRAITVDKRCVNHGLLIDWLQTLRPDLAIPAGDWPMPG